MYSWILVHKKTPNSRRRLVARHTSFIEWSFPITLPLFCGRMSIDMFETLLAKGRKKIGCWKGRLLSNGGKLALIKSVLSCPFPRILSDESIPRRQFLSSWIKLLPISFRGKKFGWCFSILMPCSVKWQWCNCDLGFNICILQAGGLDVIMVSFAEDLNQINMFVYYN